MLFVVFHLLLLIFCLCLQFSSFLITVCLCVFLLRCILPETLCFLDLVCYLLSHIREVFSCYFFIYFLRSFLCFFSFQDSYNANVGAFNVVPEVSLAVLIFFFFSILFYIFCSGAVVSTFLFSRSLIRFCASVILLSIPSSILLISVCLFVLQFFQVFDKHFLHLLNLCLYSFLKILDYLHYHYSEFFFWKVAYLYLIWLFFWGFILSLHLVQNPLLFHPGLLSVMWFCFQPLRDCGSCFFCLPSVR